MDPRRPSIASQAPRTRRRHGGRTAAPTFLVVSALFLCWGACAVPSATQSNLEDVADPVPDEVLPDMEDLDDSPTQAADTPDIAADEGHAGDPADVDDTGPATLVLRFGASTFGYVDEDITLRVEVEGDARAYWWSPGDGRPALGPTLEPEITLRWGSPDRFRVVVTAEDPEGDRRSAQTAVVVVPRPRFAPASSSSVAASPDSTLVVSISEDADLITLVRVQDSGPGEVTRLPACRGPRRVALGSAHIAVTCQHDDTVLLLGSDAAPNVAWGDRQWEVVQRIQLPWGARPFGVLFDEEDDLWIAEQGPGRLARFRALVGGSFTAVEVLDGFDDARALARLPGGALVVSAWRSQASHATLWRYSPATGERTPWHFGYERTADTSVSTSGVPSYIESISLPPDGEVAAFGGLQANVERGLHLDGRPLTFETTLRAVMVRFDPSTGHELPRGRRQFDNRGFTSAVAYSPWGDWIWVAHRGARSVERIDRFTGAQGGAVVDLGFAPSGLALTPDGRFLIVEVTYSRALRFFDVNQAGLPVDVGTVALVDNEPLPREVLRGAQLFNDTFDPRLARDGYIACSHCHLDGDADRFVWDFTDRGEGLRRTIPLLGRAGMGQGPLHWSANFDEVQDFEHDIRGAAGGHGLLREEAWSLPSVRSPLGSPKAGLSEDLDALAAYVTHLAQHPRSPWRTPEGELSAAARRGEAIFRAAETACTSCHRGEHLTDSQWLAPGEPLLHDVGTLGPTSGMRLGGALAGIDTPTLHGLWHSAPYLHDGSAPTLRAVLVDRNLEDRHGRTSHLSEAEVDDLIAYLLSL